MQKTNLELSGLELGVSGPKGRMDKVNRKRGTNKRETAT